MEKETVENETKTRLRIYQEYSTIANNLNTWFLLLSFIHNNSLVSLAFLAPVNMFSTLDNAHSTATKV